MSDSKKKGQAVDNLPIKSGSKAKVVLDLLNQMCGIFKKLKDETQGVEELSQLLDERKKLGEDLKKKEDEVFKLRTEKDVLWEEFEAKLTANEARLTALKAKEVELEKTQAHLQGSEKEAARWKTDCKKLQQQFAKQASHAKACEAAMEASDNKLRDLEIRYKRLDEKYQSAKGLLRENALEDVDLGECEDSLRDFAEQCHQKLFACFKDIEDVPVSIPRTLDSFPMLPLPLSNSRAARLMRCAAVESVVGRALTDHIFVAVYSPESTTWSKALSRVLQSLDLRDAQREQLVRRQLLVDYEVTDETREQIVRNARDSVIATLGHLLPSSPLLDGFISTLESILQEAMEVWEPLQRSIHRPIVNFELDPSHFEPAEDCYPEYGSTRSETNTGISSPVLRLLPDISIGDRMLLCPKVLWSDQTAVVDARLELEKDRQRREGASPSWTRRRMSVRHGPSSAPQSPRPSPTHIQAKDKRETKGGIKPMASSAGVNHGTASKGKENGAGQK